MDPNAQSALSQADAAGEEIAKAAEKSGDGDAGVVRHVCTFLTRCLAAILHQSEANARIRAGKPE